METGKTVRRSLGKGCPVFDAEDKILMLENVRILGFDVVFLTDFSWTLLAGESQFLTVIEPETDWHLSGLVSSLLHL